MAVSEPVTRPEVAESEALVAGFGVDIRWLDGHAASVAVTGEIDMATAPQLWERLARAIPATRERLVVDLSATTFLDSSALAVLVRAYKELGRQGADLVLCAPNPTARNVLAATGLDQVFTIEDGRPGARTVLIMSQPTAPKPHNDGKTPDEDGTKPGVASGPGHRAHG